MSEVSEDDLTEFAPYIKEYAQHFGADAEVLLAQKYFVLTPNPEAGYKQLYTLRLDLLSEKNSCKAGVGNEEMGVT